MVLVVISIDFLKAFDSVRHSPLAKKLTILDLHASVYSWIISYLLERGHLTCFKYGFISAMAYINASIVQTAVVGPTLYVVVAPYLNPKYSFTLFLKYAGDTYLLGGSSEIDTVLEEFHSISEWTEMISLLLNHNKTGEMIVSRICNTSFSIRPISP